MEEMRLQKYLAEQGIASRRAAEKLIEEGKVRLNGTIVTERGLRVRPGIDVVEVEGTVVHSTGRLRYLLLNKPSGYICSAKDERGRRTVLDLIQGVPERIYPVGRLDYDTAGLLLLTNDGELTNRLLHPSHEVEKTYRAEVEGRLDGRAIAKLKQGLRLEDGLTAPAKVRIVRQLEETSLVEITIHEGKNRQVRRMLDAVGCSVRRLKRVRFAFLDLKDLPLGSWRELTAEEITALKLLK